MAGLSVLYYALKRRIYNKTYMFCYKNTNHTKKILMEYRMRV